jgi:hypothetical protein
MTRAPLLLIALLSTTALAEEPTQAPATPAPLVEQLPPAPATLGTLTPARLQALRTYKSQRLQVRAETEYRGGGVATFSTMTYGYPHGMGSGVIVTEPVSTFRTWGVYRGPQRLSTPDFLTLTEATAQRDELVTTIKKSRRASRAWFTGAGVGMAAIVTGIVGMGAGGVDTYGQYNRVALVGTTLTIGCLFGASFPAAKASKLYRYPGASMDTDAANVLAHAHNERLRQQLQIQPSEAWLLDLGATE